MACFYITTTLLLLCTTITAQCEDGTYKCDIAESPWYHWCVHGQWMLQTCAAGLKFNTQIMGCDWPQNADCTDYTAAMTAAPTTQPPVTTATTSPPTTTMKQVTTATTTKITTTTKTTPPTTTKTSPPTTTKTTAPPITTSQTTTGTTKKVEGCGGKTFKCYPGDPARYYWCIHNIWVAYTCPGVLHFNPIISGCDWPNNADCTNEQSGETSELTSQAPATTAQPFTSPTPAYEPGVCSPASCQLPNCQCAGKTTIPANLPKVDTPQLVMLTFDDFIVSYNYPYFTEIFSHSRKNPNGCPIRGAFYVSEDGQSDYALVDALHKSGHEIASHTLNHGFGTTDYQHWIDEAVGMKNQLSTQANIPIDEIVGFRAPYLQMGADGQYQALTDHGFTYDTSMATGDLSPPISDPIWPFTLDYPVTYQESAIGPNPTGTYPGFWEIPIIRWYSTSGIVCAMPDFGCGSNRQVSELLTYFTTNFNRHYDTNKAPFGIFIHASWFNTEPHSLEALKLFLDELLQKDDVWIVTPKQVIDWNRNPTPLSELADFQPFDC